MPKGHRDGKIMDGQTYDSVLPEAYAKVKHQRDQVVAGFNKLKQMSNQTTADLLEIRSAANDLIEAVGEAEYNREVMKAARALQVLV